MAGELDVLKTLPANTQLAVNLGIGVVVTLVGIISFFRKLLGEVPATATPVASSLFTPSVVELLERLVEALEKIEKNVDKEVDERMIERRVEERAQHRQQRPSKD